MKAKTHSGAAKRMKITRNGKSKKVLMRKSCKNHLLTNKSKRQKSLCENHGMPVDKANVKRVKRLLNI